MKHGSFNDWTSIVFARWRPYAPCLIHASKSKPQSTYRSVQPFSGPSQSWPTHRHTDTDTDRPRYTQTSVAVARIYAVSACDAGCWEVYVRVGSGRQWRWWRDIQREGTSELLSAGGQRHWRHCSGQIEGPGAPEDSICASILLQATHAPVRDLIAPFTTTTALSVRYYTVLSVFCEGYEHKPLQTVL